MSLQIERVAHSEMVGGTQTALHSHDHGSLGGKGDDDHSQYYNSARHTKAIHDALNIDSDTLDSLSSGSFLRSNVDDNLTAAIIVPTGNRDEGIFGTYVSTKTQHIWSMGTGYRNSPTGANFGNLYGLAYKYNGVAGGHGVYLVNNGAEKSALGLNVWTSGRFISTIATGTAPLTVASTTRVVNLNADLWDGYQFASYLNHAVKTTSIVTHAGLGLDGNLDMKSNDIVQVDKIVFGVSAPYLSSVGMSATNVVANSAKLAGYLPSTSAGNNTIVRRTSSGYIYCNYLNTTSGATTGNPTHYFVETGNDSFLRQSTPANFITQLVADGLMPKSGGTFTGYTYARDHGTAATDMIVNVCYGTGNPPTANTTTIGTLFVKYTA